jgi:hypothetical protein
VPPTPLNPQPSPATSLPESRVGIPISRLLISLGILLLVSAIDYATHNELLFVTFYFVPVSLCAWHLGRNAGLGMALLSGIAWWLADRLAGSHYEHALSTYWNSLICFLAFAAIGITVSRLKLAIAKREQLNTELSRALADLRQSTEKTRELQGHLQVMCAWTKRVQVEGKWISVDEFLTDHLQIHLTHGISPEAARQLLDEAQLPPKPEEHNPGSRSTPPPHPPT